MSLEQLKGKILGPKVSELQSFFYLMKELGCVPEVIGRDYEVFDPSGKLVFKIRQKPMKVSQMILLMDELKSYYKREEQKMKGSKRKR